MKILSLLTSRYLLLFLQQLVSIWFLADFFLARDSSNAQYLWKSGLKQKENPSQIENLINVTITKHCSRDALGEPLFEKVVLVVIDALGAEFIPAIEKQNEAPGHNDSGERRAHMPFLEESILHNRAMAFIAKAATPTVTMPRIKALLSGTIPSFADIIYNLAADVSNFEDDNILRIARAHNKTLVFYGDDTWLSLFNKSMFKRSQETLSFFASDYTTVDTNVTERAIPETETTNIDWDYLILHYLGLDHIGHVFGSNKHDLIFTKLLEMDRVIKKIFDNMSSKDHKTLIIVCGDHGMSEEGNHGGDGYLEANTAMVFLPVNQNLRVTSGSDDTIVSNQIDFAVTLSFLTGLPIPQMSKGVALDQLLGRFWSTGEEYKSTCAALENTRQLINLIGHEEFMRWPVSSTLIRMLESHDNLRNSHTNLAGEYFNLLRQIQIKLLESIASRTNPSLIVIVLIIVTFLTLFSLRKLGIRLLLPIISKYERWACLSTFITPIMMHGSTDFIEFEYYFWPPYSLSVFSLFALISSVQNRPEMSQFDNHKVTFFAIFFVVTSIWNPLKFSRNNSIVSVLITPAIALTILFNSIRQKSDIKYYKNKLAMGVCILIMLSKYIEESSDHDNLRINIQRIAMLAVILHTVLNVLSTSTLDNQQFGSSITVYKLASGLISIAFLLSRRHNFFYLISNVIMETSLNSIANSLKLSLTSRAILYATFAQSSFYNQGNSNSFSSIDVRPAFYGQTSFNIYLSIPLVLFATYSTQIYWTMKLLQRVQEAKTNKKCAELESRNDNNESIVMYISDFVIARNFLNLSYYMFVCLVLRNHLFIWSVISPKLLYLFVTNNVLLVTVKLISNVHKIKLPRVANLHDL